MVRYINAENMYKEVWKRSTSPLNEWDTWGVLNVLDMVKTEDVVPVVHAHWYRKHKDSPFYYCSNCDGSSASIVEWAQKYCYHCGAKMDEVTNNA